MIGKRIQTALLVKWYSWQKRIRYKDYYTQTLAHIITYTSLPSIEYIMKTENNDEKENAKSIIHFQCIASTQYRIQSRLWDLVGSRTKKKEIKDPQEQQHSPWSWAHSIFVALRFVFLLLLLLILLIASSVWEQNHYTQPHKNGIARVYIALMSHNIHTMWTMLTESTRKSTKHSFTTAQ